MIVWKTISIIGPGLSCVRHIACYSDISSYEVLNKLISDGEKNRSTYLNPFSQLCSWNCCSHLSNSIAE